MGKDGSFSLPQAAGSGATGAAVCLLANLGPQHFPGRPIDEVQLGARKAGDRLVVVLTALYIVR